MNDLIVLLCFSEGKSNFLRQVHGNRVINQILKNAFCFISLPVLLIIKHSVR